MLRMESGLHGGWGRGGGEPKTKNLSMYFQHSFLTEQQGFWPMWQIITLTEELCFYVHYLNNLAVAEAILSTPLNSIIEVYLIGSMGTPSSLSSLEELVNNIKC